MCWGEHGRESWIIVEKSTGTITMTNAKSGNILASMYVRDITTDISTKQVGKKPQ